MREKKIETEYVKGDDGLDLKILGMRIIFTQNN